VINIWNNKKVIFSLVSRAWFSLVVKLFEFDR